MKWLGIELISTLKIAFSLFFFVQSSEMAIITKTTIFGCLYVGGFQVKGIREWDQLVIHFMATLNKTFGVQCVTNDSNYTSLENVDSPFSLERRKKRLLQLFLRAISGSGKRSFLIFEKLVPLCLYSEK